MGLATRVIPVLLWDEHGCVKGKQFNPGRRIGSMMDRIRLLERRDVDELIILDIAATPNNRGPRFEEVSALCENLFCPVTVGGGVRNVSDIRRLLASGADKVAINTMALDQPDFIDAAAKRFGSQAIVASIDAGGDRCVHRLAGRQATARAAVQWALELEDRGAGEILLQSVERDGTMGGYDIELVRDVSAAVDIPVVAGSGCGSYEHLAEVLYGTKAHAVAVGAAFQFTECTPKGASRYLADLGFQMRL